MKIKIGTSLLSICISLSMLAFSFTKAFAGNDFIVTDLRVDLGGVYNALDYKLSLGSYEGYPGNHPTYTAGWLGIYLANNPGLFGKQFTQVGIITDSTGIYWFVYAEPGVTCLRGSYYWWNAQAGKSLGCIGNIGDLVGFNRYHDVELVSYQHGEWIARVSDQFGVAHDVATIPSASVYIYGAQANVEEAYVQNQDPYELAQFMLWHPKYYDYNYGTFVDWPPSEGSNKNTLSTTDLNGINSFCPQHYGAIVNINNDERSWYGGTNGNICDWMMFPGDHNYLPIIVKD